MPKYAKPVAQQATAKKSSATPWIIGAGVLFVLLILLAVMLNSRQTPTVTASSYDVPAEWVNGNVLGNPDAPVTIQTWEDFICPACQQWTATVKPRVFEEYVKSGQVKLEFRQFPLSQHNPGATMAAQASLCAADQNGFWPYHDRLFQEASARGQAAMELQELVKYADEAGLDGQALLQCMNAQTHARTALDEVNQAISNGYNSTPTIVINGQPSPQAYSWEGLKAEVDRLLAAAGASN